MATSFLDRTMTQPRVTLLALAFAVSLAGCGGSISSASLPASTPSASAGSPSRISPSAGDRSACGLSSASQAAAALGMAVGNAQPEPLAPGSGNGAKGSTCQWVKLGTGSSGYSGSVGISTIAYPSSAKASKLFSESSAAGVVPGEKLIYLPPGLAPGESANVSVLQNEGAADTRIATALLMAGNRELSIDIAEPTSAHFSEAAFVALVKQVAHAWY
jgi:hypothetical protein